jgi:glutathione S-transferase
MPELELIGAAPSNYVWVCRIALAEKGVPYKLARKSVQQAVPTWMPGQARAEKAA